MNLMGKILTLLIFFLSICFLVIAVMVGAAHQNWQEQANENKEVAERAWTPCARMDAMREGIKRARSAHARHVRAWAPCAKK